MGVWPQDAPDEMETVIIRIEAGRCTELNGEAMDPLPLMEQANDIAGRNGVWMKNALENRIIGTKSRGVYEAPGMELLGNALESVYQATMDYRSTRLFRHLSDLVGTMIYDGRLYDPATRAALAGIDKLTENATGTVELGLYRGNIFFKSMTDCPNSLYFPAHASMEASDGLNPHSSQGYLEVQAVQALSMAAAGHIKPV